MAVSAFGATFVIVSYIKQCRVRVVRCHVERFDGKRKLKTTEVTGEAALRRNMATLRHEPSEGEGG